MHLYRTTPIKKTKAALIVTLFEAPPIKNKAPSSPKGWKYTVIQHSLKIVMDHFTYLLMDHFSPDTERTTYVHQ